MVFSSSSTILASVKVGDLVSLNAKVSEFRSASRPNDLHLTELISPTKIAVLSSGNPVVPIVLGRDRSPPTQHISSLDSGPDGFLSVPANQSLQETPNHRIEPARYGLDFWESLEGQVVTIPKPISLGFGNSFNEFWVRGSWRATGVNSRGGLSITFGACTPRPSSPIRSSHHSKDRVVFRTVTQKRSSWVPRSTVPTIPVQRWAMSTTISRV